jgi:hypothetical protein
MLSKNEYKSERTRGGDTSEKGPHCAVANTMRQV